MLGDAAKKRLARKFFESQGAAFLSVIAHRERQLVEQVRDLQDAADVDGDVFGELPEPEDRVAQMQAFALAMLDDSAHEWYLREMAGMDNVDEALDHVGRPVDDWASVCSGWAGYYRDEHDMEGDDQELADYHVRARYGVDLDTFESVVVNWGDDDEKALVEDVLAGGITTAETGIETVADELQDEGE